MEGQEAPPQKVRGESRDNETRAPNEVDVIPKDTVERVAFARDPPPNQTNGIENTRRRGSRINAATP